MASLTQTAIITRKIIRYGFFGIIFLIVGKFVLDVSVGVYRKINPLPPPPPTVTFGKLPDIKFPQKAHPELKLTLETPNGEFPDFPDQMRVIFMPQPTSNLLSLDTAKVKASNLGYSPNAEELTETTYRFTSDKVPANLDMNIITGVFSISYNLTQDSSPLVNKPPSPEAAAAEVRSYLSGGNILFEDLTDRFSHEFRKIKEGRLVKVTSLSEADFIKVNIFRNNIDEFPIVTRNPNEANIWFLIGGARQREKQIIAAEYHYFPADYSKTATYPIKTAQEAWDELLAGNGYIASSSDLSEVTIRRVYLAYYDSNVPAEFLQPVVVFEGDNDFFGYIPAVTSQYLGD